MTQIGLIDLILPCCGRSPTEPPAFSCPVAPRPAWETALRLISSVAHNPIIVHLPHDPGVGVAAGAGPGVVRLLPSSGVGKGRM